jgi:hypothetical protein
MRRSIPSVLAILAAISAAPVTGVMAQDASRVATQSAVDAAVPANPGTLRGLCEARPDGDPFLAEVLRARDLETEEAIGAALQALEPQARRMAEEAPTDVAAQYRLAAVMGAGLDIEHGTSKVSGASELHPQVVRVLQLQPDHPGASYMLGKMHASILRMSGLKRFMAKTLLGGAAMEGASWEEAQARLELAARAEPCVPEHHFELARAYAEQGHTEGWERELASVLELTADGTSAREARLRQRSEEFAREWRQKSP